MSDPKKNSSNAVVLVGTAGEVPARTIARCLTDPVTGAAGTLDRLYRGASMEGDVNGYVAELKHLAKAVSAGDLSRSEAMLTTQAHTLDALFHKLIGWGLNHVKEGGNAVYFETCMRLGLKAQSQSRATNETLAAIKNPPVVYARQANFANGHQQVNNGVALSRTRENEIPPNKLLEAINGERMDTGTTGAAIGADKNLAPMDAFNGAAHPER